MKNNRIKAEALDVPGSIEEAAEILRRIGEAQRRVAKVEGDMNEYLASVREKYERIATPINQDIERWFKSLHAWAEAHRVELLSGQRTKTVRLASGEICWRNTPPSVSVPKKPEKLAAIILALKRRRLLDLVRTKEEINKEAILAEPARVDGVNGITIRKYEEFVATPDETKIERAVTIKRGNKK